MKNEVRKFTMMAWILSGLMLTMVLTVIPFERNFGVKGLAAWGLIAVATIAYSIRVEKFKKAHGLRTYNEISAFMEGRQPEFDDEKIDSTKKIATVICKLLFGAGIALIILSFVK